jgi:hypothetical protein
MSELQEKWEFEFFVSWASWALPFDVTIRFNDVVAISVLCFNFRWSLEEQYGSCR